MYSLCTFFVKDWALNCHFGIHLGYTLVSKDESNCILWKLRTVCVCPRQRWKVAVILLGSIVGNRWHNLQMYSFQFSTSAIMQICIFTRLSVLLSSVSYILLEEDDVIFMPVSANAFVEFIVGFLFLLLFLWFVVPFLVCQQTMEVLSLWYSNVLELNAVISNW